MSNKGKYWDEAWNTVIGCTKCSPGCLNCWAENLHNMRYGAYWTAAKLPEQYRFPFSEIQLLPDRLDKPLHTRNPRTIFVNDMGDTFHPAVPFEFVDYIVSTMMSAKWHKYLILTKRADRMLEYPWSRWADGYSMNHIWLGTTICNKVEKWKANVLRSIPATHRWLSLEPLLGNLGELNLEGIDWVVVGCESGKNRRPCKIEWIESIVEQCKAAGVKCFVKQISLNGKVSKKMEDWPVALQVRNEI